jgi:hypothetical protein
MSICHFEKFVFIGFRNTVVKIKEPCSAEEANLLVLVPFIQNMDKVWNQWYEGQEVGTKWNVKSS